MGKTETYNKVVEGLNAIFTEANVKKSTQDKILAFIDETIKPLSGGGKRIPLEDLVLRDDQGNITHIKEALSGYFLPANAEIFYEEKEEAKGINGLKRLSRKAEAIRKETNRIYVASKNAITTDVLEGVISREVGKQRLEELKSKPDYTSLLEIAGAIDPSAVAN